MTNTTEIKACASCKTNPRTSGSYCGDCATLIARKNRAKRDYRGRLCNRCRTNTVTSISSPKCSDCQRELARQAREADPELARRNYLWQHYRITPEEYDAMLSVQDGKCAICRQPPLTLPLAVDHDHTCCPGKRSCGRCVRALLCVYCNSTVGKLETGSFNAHLTYIDNWKEARLVEQH